ncbi:MAG: MFS transporter [Xanthomonadales bacterium]|nr:MFS transporter [Xanthomonadales bacterium]
MPGFRGYPARAFVVCLVAYTTAQMDLALFGYATPAIREEFGLSLSGVMAIVSCAFVLGGILIVWLGLWTDRWGRKGMFQFSLVGSSLLVTLHSVVPNPVSLSVLRGLSIAVGGLTYPVTGAVIAEEFQARVRGLFMGLLQIGYPLGWALASVWAAWLLSDLGWRLLFLVGLVSLPFVWVVRRVIREPPRFTQARQQQEQPRIRELLAPGVRHRTLLLFSAQFLFVWAYAGSIFLFPSYLNENRDLEAFDFSLLIGAGNAIGIIGYVLAAVTGEFWMTRRNTVVLWTLLGAATFQVMVWFTQTYTELLIAYAVMSMFFYGSAAVKFAYLAEVFPTRLRATALSTCGSLAVTLGSAGGPFVVALAVERLGWNLGYAVLVGVPLAAAGLLYTFLTPVPSGLEVEEVEAFLARSDARGS